MTPLRRREKTAQVRRRLRSCYGSSGVQLRTSPPVDVLIATILSQNTTDRNSERAWRHLRQTFRSWDEVVSARTERLANVIREGGLPRPKARTIKSTLQALKKKTGRYSLAFLKGFSDDEAMRYLESLHGVGPKTAACVLVFGFGRDVFPVDTHIHRIVNRVGLVTTKNAEQTFEVMKPLLPRNGSYSFHLDLLQFGKEVCRAIDPRCDGCPLFSSCTYPSKHAQKRKRKRATGVL